MQIITNQFQKELKQHGNEQFPFLVSYQKLSEYESGSFMWHWHPEIEITYVQKGTMCYKVNHMVYHLKEGDIVFNNSGALHSGTMENQKDCAYIPVTFDSRLIYGFFQSTVNSKYVDPVIQDSMLPAICIDQSEPWHKPFREYLLRIIDLDEKKPDFYELDITICLQSIWRLLLEHITYEPQASRENSLEYDRIKKILSYIEENYQNHIELQNVAELCCMSMYTFCRVFKQATDYTFVEYLNHIRLKSAEKLLLSTKLPISEVAYESGFSGLSYFNRKFKEVYSMGPSRYRKISGNEEINCEGYHHSRI